LRLATAHEASQKATPKIARSPVVSAIWPVPGGRIAIKWRQNVTSISASSHSRMRQFLDRASMSFAAAAFGALVASLAIWAAGAYHLTARLGIDIAPGLSAD